MMNSRIGKQRWKALMAVSLAIVGVFSGGAAEACTTTLVTPGASADGSSCVTHSNDTWDSDPNLVYVPAKDHPAGSLRNVYPSAVAWEDFPDYACQSLPRLNDGERAPGYDFPDRPRTKPLGAIPEASHTYAYIDSDYAVMNEHGLMFGECTNCSARLEYLAPGEGHGLFYASELARVALERCRTAREAVVLMGELIDQYGLWGTGETLLVADADEGWVMEMQPVPSGQGGLWIAQQVPDGEFFVAANQFRIRGIQPGNPRQIFNSRLPNQLQQLGWAVNNKAGDVDWVASLKAEEDFHPYFALRRVWRALNLVAPSAALPARVKNYDTEAYPFSIRPDHPLTVQDLMELHRDAYEGTAYDKTKGAAAGFFGYPARHGDVKWERSIYAPNAAYTWITQTNKALPAPVAWFAIHPAKESVFVPLTVGPLPECYGGVRRDTYDAAKFWWTGMEVAGFARGYYNNMMPKVYEAARAQEARSVDLLRQSAGKAPDAFATALLDNAEQNLRDWRALYQKLLTDFDGGRHLNYADGQQPAGDKLDKY